MPERSFETWYDANVVSPDGLSRREMHSLALQTIVATKARDPKTMSIQSKRIAGEVHSERERGYWYAQDFNRADDAEGEDDGEEEVAEEGYSGSEGDDVVYDDYVGSDSD